MELCSFYPACKVGFSWPLVNGITRKWGKVVSAKRAYGWAAKKCVFLTQWFWHLPHVHGLKKIGNCLFCKRKYCKMVIFVWNCNFFDKYGPIWPTVPRLRIAGQLLKARIAIFTAHCALSEKQICNRKKKYCTFLMKILWHLFGDQAFENVLNAPNWVLVGHHNVN